MTTREPVRIDVSELTEAVLVSVRQALQEREAPDASVPPVFMNPRIICGIILEPGEGLTPHGAGQQ
jgi:hypothetical protein